MEIGWLLSGQAFYYYDGWESLSFPSHTDYYNNLGYIHMATSFAKPVLL